MDKYFKILEYDKVLEKLSSFALSELGKQVCLNLRPCESISLIKEHLSFTEQAYKIINSGLNFPLNQVYSISQMILDCKSGKVPENIKFTELKFNLAMSRYINNFLSKYKSDYNSLYELSENLYSNTELEDKIKNIFDEANNVKDTASLELKSLRQSLRENRENLKLKVNSLLNNPEFSKYLQDSIYTYRDGHIVFQVKAENRNKIIGIVHDASSSLQTYFIEPKEIIPLSNKIREIEIQIEKEIYRILKELSNIIAIYSEDLLKLESDLAFFDFILAKARYAIKYKFSLPIISEDEKIISLKEMENPILIDYCDNIVKNDFFMEVSKNIIIITGSNTGGKTVILKTIGLCTLMMNSGLFIPAVEGKIYPFKKIMADIGDEQSIAQSLSTFSSHMNNIVNIINNSDEDTLVLLDEIASGTDPEQGSALAISILEYLQKNNTFCICTTHFGELKNLAYIKSGFKNASVDFDINTLSPTYKLLMDIPGLSHALSIAKNLGLNDSIINRSKEIISFQSNKTEEVIQELQSTHRVLEESSKNVINIEKDLKSVKSEYYERLEALKKDKKKSLISFKKKYQTKFEELRKELKELSQELNREKTEKVARRTYSRLGRLESEAREQFSQDEFQLSNNYIDVSWDDVKLNQKLLIKNLNQEVILLSYPDKQNNVKVKIGQITTTVKSDRLAIFESKYIIKNKNLKSRNIKNIEKGPFKFERNYVSNTLDLRGYRVNEALDTLDIYLDKASLNNLTPVYIIHGNGTGALKNAIWEYVKDSPYVSKYRQAEQNQGGSGVLVIDIY